jgi:hypothetical protein
MSAESMAASNLPYLALKQSSALDDRSSEAHPRERGVGGQRRRECGDDALLGIDEKPGDRRR